MAVRTVNVFYYMIVYVMFLHFGTKSADDSLIFSTNIYYRFLS